MPEEPHTIMERVAALEERLAHLERRVLGRPCGYDVHLLEPIDPTPADD